jgi:phosphatidylserine/phosphatidylglycerophosphate/cardiolipin synthase-like enzyme
VSLDLLAAARADRPPIEDVIDIVTTGPNLAGVANRDTRLVVTDLFRAAQKSVLIAGYAVYQGQKVFEVLAARMSEVPDLEVRMHLDIQRGRDTSAASEIERRFAKRFRETQWPAGARLPVVYYDPRSLEMDAGNLASLHAKCVVVDRSTVFVSSANFTEAAQEKNIELGLMLRSLIVADRICRFFEQLVSADLLKKVISS